MRVLVSSASLPGHLIPMLPLAAAFASRGDEVLVATAPEAAEMVAQSGLQFRAVGRDTSEWFAELGRRIRGKPGDGVPLSLRPSALPVVDGPPVPAEYADPMLPLVYLTLGTLMNRDFGLFRMVLAALADEPVNVLVTIGRDNDPAQRRAAAGGRQLRQRDHDGRGGHSNLPDARSGERAGDRCRAARCDGITGLPPAGRTSRGRHARDGEPFAGR